MGTGIGLEMLLDCRTVCSEGLRLAYCWAEILEGKPRCRWGVSKCPSKGDRCKGTHMAGVGQLQAAANRRETSCVKGSNGRVRAAVLDEFESPTEGKRMALQEAHA